MNAVDSPPTSAAISHSPDFCLYSIRYADGSPPPAGSVHFTYSLVSDAGSAETLRGWPGLACLASPPSSSGFDSSDGVAPASFDGFPVPTEFIALTRNTYSVSSSRSPTVYSVPELRVLDLAASYSSSPSSASLYSILYPVTGGEPLSLGSLHFRRTSLSDMSSAVSDLGFPGATCS